MDDRVIVLGVSTWCNAAKLIDRFSYLPFGAGPRTCIGQNFAQMEAAAVMATFLRSFQLKLRPGYTPEPRLRVTLRPAGGNADAIATTMMQLR